MPDYRAYIVDEDGHFKNVHVFNAADRSEATIVALGLVDGHAVELWEGGERVGEFRPDKAAGLPASGDSADNKTPNAQCRF